MLRGTIRNLNSAFEILADLILLSILWCICGAGIITMLPASNALFKTAEQTMKDKKAYPLKMFMTIFKTNFRRKLVAGVCFTLAVILIVLVITCSDFMYARNKGNAFFPIFSRIVLSYALVLHSYLAAVLDQNLSVKRLFCVGLFYSLKYMLTSMTLLCILGFGVLAVIMMPVCLLFIPGITAIASVYLFADKIA